MTLELEIPGRETLLLEHLVLDVNGTLTNRGVLVDGVTERLARLARTLEVHLLSADTFGTLGTLSGTLGLEGRTITTAEDKARIVRELGTARCVAIGNGRNDADMLAASALGITVIGPEGAAAAALLACDAVAVSIVDALELLLDERALAATLRA